LWRRTRRRKCEFWGGGQAHRTRRPSSRSLRGARVVSASRGRKVFFLFFFARSSRLVLALFLFFLSPLLPPDRFCVCASSTGARGQDAQRRQCRVVSSANLCHHRGRRRRRRRPPIEIGPLLARRGRWALAARAFWPPSHLEDVFFCPPRNCPPRSGQQALCARGK